MRNKIFPKVYLQSWEYAAENGQEAEYRASMRANIACKQAIEAAIPKYYHVNGHTLDVKSCAKELVTEFGLERVAYVLANTIRRKCQDGRISPENRHWAYTVSVVYETQVPAFHTVNCRFVVDSCNPGLTDLLTTQIRKLHELQKSAVRKK